MPDKTLFLKQAQSKIDKELEKCKSVKDFVDLVFSYLILLFFSCVVRGY